MDQDVHEWMNTFHTLHTNMGIKDFERHMELKYCSYFNKYIQEEMNLLDILLLVVSYQCAAKIE